MTMEGKQAKKEYMKKWRLNNKDKIKASNDRYWNSKAMLAMETQAKRVMVFK